MQGTPISILEHFSQLEDPRVDRTKRYKLTDVIAICAANGWTIDLPSAGGEVPAIKCIYSLTD